MSTEKDIADIKAFCERLRADLSATNSALFALFASVPGVYRDRVLEQLAKRSVQRSEYAEKLQDPAVERALEQMEAADQRVYKELQRVNAERHAEGL